MIIFTRGRLDTKERCNSKSAALSIALMQRVARKKRDISETGGGSTQPTCGRSQIQCFVQIRQDAEDSPVAGNPSTQNTDKSTNLQLSIGKTWVVGSSPVKKLFPQHELTLGNR